MKINGRLFSKFNVDSPRRNARLNKGHFSLIANRCSLTKLRSAGSSHAFPRGYEIEMLKEYTQRPPLRHNGKKQKYKYIKLFISSYKFTPKSSFIIMYEMKGAPTTLIRHQALFRYISFSFTRYFCLVKC